MAPSDFWLFASLKNISKEIYFTCDYKFQAIIRKWLQEILNNSKSMGSKNLLTTGSFVSNNRETMWKNYVFQSTHSEIHFVVLYFDALSGSKNTTTTF